MAFRNWTIIGYFLISSASVFAGAQEEIFLKANEAYKNNDFAQAEQLYASIAKKGVAVWYNMGLTAQALDKPPYALAYFHKALQQAGPAEYWLIKKQINIIYPEDSFTAWIASYAQYASSFLSLMHWQMLLILCLIIFVLFARRLKVYILFILLSSMVTMCALIFARHYLISNEKFFVKATMATMYTGPGKNFSIKATIPLYQHGTILQERDSWYRVRYNKLKGWLEANDIVIA